MESSMYEEKKRLGKIFLTLLVMAMFAVAGLLFFRAQEELFQKGNRNYEIEQAGKRYGNSIFYQYQDKIYAAIPSGGLYVIQSADIKSFQPINPGEYLDHQVGKDKDRVYFGDLPIPDLDATKIKALGNNYYSDGEKTYYCSNLSVVNSEQSFWKKILLPLFSGEKAQSYLYPYREVKTSENLEIIKGLPAFAQDGKNVYYKGLGLEEANPRNMREIQGENYTEYFADGEHVYYQEKLLPLLDNKDLRTLWQERGDVEYLFNPLNGELFIGENYLKDSRPPYTILGENSSHVETFFLLSRDGIYYYDFQKKKERRAGDYIFNETMEEITPSVFADKEDLYYLKSQEIRSKNRRTRNMLLALETAIYRFDKKEGFEKIKEAPNPNFGSLWKKGEKYYYFDNLGPSQGIFDTIYELAEQESLESLEHALGNPQKIVTLIEEKKLIPFDGERLIVATVKINHWEVMLRRILFFAIVGIGILFKIFEKRKKDRKER